MRRRDADTGAFLVRGGHVRYAVVGLFSAVAIAAMAVTASRIQLDDGGPGLLGVTVPVPAAVLLLVSALAAGTARSLRTGLAVGLAAALAGFAALCAVLAVEGLVWMDRVGVFILDADPPQGPADAADVVLDVFSTGMWAGHVLVWSAGVVFGSCVGAVLARDSSASRSRTA